MKTCAIEGCDRPQRTRTMCNLHYERARRGRIPMLPRLSQSFDLPDDVRFWSRVAGATDDPLDCWLWVAGKMPEGYGSFPTRRGTRLAHRWSYEQMIGPIPEGLVLDHLCRTTACVNPWHLDPVTNAINIQRGYDAKPPPLACAHGHPYTPENTGRGSGGRRYCRTCHRDRQRERGRKERALQRALRRRVG